MANTELDLDVSTDEVWEPYSLQLGAVVRIRLSGECNTKSLKRVAVNEQIVGNSKSQYSHPKVYNNEIGVIVAIIRDEYAEGHYYRVMITKGLWDTNDQSTCVGADFAAVELEYVERHIRLAEWQYIINNCKLFKISYPEYWSIHRIIKDDNEQDQDHVVCMGSLTDTVCGGHK